jgi:hypothetical protein
LLTSRPSTVIRLGDFGLQPLAEAGSVANHPKANAVAVQLAHLATQHRHEQFHQGVDFPFRTAPVLAGKRKQGQRLHLGTGGKGHGLTHGFHARLVPGNPHLAAVLGPATIAIHDDGDVTGQGRAGAIA